MSLILAKVDIVSRADASALYAELGWHVVAMKPDRSGAYQKYASVPIPSPNEARARFERYPNALLCIKLPPNIVVLDLDPRERELEQICSELRTLFSLPKTSSVSTPKGGLHLWFELPDGVIAKNWTSQHGKFPVAGIDIRTNGGLATLPPSIRGDGTYTWDNWVPKLPKAPKLLVEALTPKQVSVGQHYSKPWVPRSVSSKYAEAALEGEFRRVAFAPSGTRNHNLFVAAANLGSLFAAGLIADARKQLERAAAHCGLIKDDGLSSAQATIASGWKRGCANPRVRGGANG